MAAPLTAETTAAPGGSAPTNLAPSGPALCATSQLQTTVKPGSAGLGHAGAVLVFENKEGPCVLRAYAGVDGLRADGGPAIHARRTPNGYLGGPRPADPKPTVNLQAGRTASALLEGASAPVDGQPPCPTFTALLVTPPNETHSVRLPVDFTVCDAQVHPVVPGPSGRVR